MPVPQNGLAPIVGWSGSHRPPRQENQALRPWSKTETGRLNSFASSTAQPVPPLTVSSDWIQPIGEQLVRVVHHVEDRLHDRAHDAGVVVAPSHAAADDLHRDVALRELVGREDAHAVRPLHVVALERERRLVDPPALGRAAELGLGALVAAGDQVG